MDRIARLRLVEPRTRAARSVGSAAIRPVRARTRAAVASRSSASHGSRNVSGERETGGTFDSSLIGFHRVGEIGSSSGFEAVAD